MIFILFFILFYYSLGVSSLRETGQRCVLWVQLKSHWDSHRECTSSNEAAGCQYGIKMWLGYIARPGKLSQS